MESICPHCETVTKVEKIFSEEEYDIRGEAIAVPVEYFKCAECKEDFDDPMSDQDPIALAYIEYRNRKQMLQPEEIKNFRRSFDLTQKELSELFGWGGATLSRYENGALQDEAHETTLQLTVKEPANLIMLLKRNPKALNDKKREALITDLLGRQRAGDSMRAFFESHFANYIESKESGFKKLDIQKLFNLVLHFCSNGVLKTKLNKLLFYADFKHFKDYSTSITGVKYVKFQYGPVPDRYKYYFAFLSTDEGSISIEEKQIHQFDGEVFTAQKRPDLTIFSETELNTMKFVKSHFKDFTATETSDMSHKEKGYIETNDNDFISYEYAEDLLI